MSAAYRLTWFMTFTLVGMGALMAQGVERPIVIAHRGASGYLPEHTLPAKAFAYALGADYIEQDVVLTKDDVPVVLHDIHLDTISDVAKQFPDRARDDGRFYAIDLTLEEIQSLNATERFNPKTGKRVFTKRFPAGKSTFRIPTLAAEIELIQGLNASTGRQVGIYPEIKSPAFHRKAGKDISKIVLDVLKEYGYDSADDLCFVQCFEPDETRRLRTELKTQLPLIQLIGENSWGDGKIDYDAMRTQAGLKSIAEYATGIGPALNHVVEVEDKTLRPSSLVADAHALDLKVHPYTLRVDELPKWAESYEQLIKTSVLESGVDGVFSDHPDQTAALLTP